MRQWRYKPWYSLCWWQCQMRQWSYKPWYSLCWSQCQIRQWIYKPWYNLCWWQCQMRQWNISHVIIYRDGNVRWGALMHLRCEKNIYINVSNDTWLKHWYHISNNANSSSQQTQLCWINGVFNVGSMSATLGQHYANIGSPPAHLPTHWSNAGLMLARRLRRRPNINPALGQRSFLLGGICLFVIYVAF